MNNKFYPDVKSNVSFPEIEKEIQKYWKQNKIFDKSLQSFENKCTDRNSEFVFYDGPPFANGLPHYGHLLTGFIKDVFARYKTTQGKKVERKFGWDCHGLPAEMQTEKELGFSGRSAITEFGIDKFNAHCKSLVMKYSHDWEEYLTRQARWVDFNNSYRTMDKDYMESVIWVFKELYNKGLIYKSMRVMPYSWACETPLSNFETRLDNSYKERVDKAVTVIFTLSDKPKNSPDGFKDYKILAWTTTPWTLVSNLALAVNANFDYVFIPKDDTCYIIAKFALENYSKELNIKEDKTGYRIIKGKELNQLNYIPLFDYFKSHKNSFKILTGDFVLEGNGTGIVHIAPGFGEDDQVICENQGIKLVCPVDNSGKFTSEIYDLFGVHVFEANDSIITKLKQKGNWLKTEQYIHSYPHCWRTDTPLIYKAVPSWYVKVTKIKDRMVELNQQINWSPSHIKDGLFGKWLENAKDWSISRNRFWGTPIPVWISNDPKYPRIDVYGSCKEIEKDFGTKVDDLHKPFIDNLTRSNPDDPTGKSMMIRVKDVFDCWFESGSMPYGQVHYPFENKEWFENHFPADFIVEYSAQTRGWFYTLMVISTALFDRPPFLNCMCHGVILDSTGQKLSKRLNNYPDPLDLFDQYGADALRVTMLSSNVIKGQDLLIDKKGEMVFNTLRLFIKPIWNAYHFFCLYSNLDSIRSQYDTSSTNTLDQYILSKIKISVSKIEEAMDRFDTVEAYSIISTFFEVLNNWYIRRSRARFWKSKQDKDKISAYNTLYTCLETMTKAMSSLLPLISESIYLGLTSKNNSNSVHLEKFPKLESINIDIELVDIMDQVLDICSIALFIRSKENIRVRQPIASLKIISENSLIFRRFEDLIKDEINVKSIIYSDNLEKNSDLKLSINFSILGKRLPQKMKDIIKMSKNGNWKYFNDKLYISGEQLLKEEYSLILSPKNSYGSKSFSNNKGIVCLDLSISRDLKDEGYARDLVRFIQQARKDAGFKVSDRIKLNIKANPDLMFILTNYWSLITNQTLSEMTENFKPEYTMNADLNGYNIFIELLRK